MCSTYELCPSFYILKIFWIWRGLWVGHTWWYWSVLFLLPFDSHHYWHLLPWTEPGSVACKASILTSVYSLKPQYYGFKQLPLFLNSFGTQFSVLGGLVVQGIHPKALHVRFARRALYHHLSHVLGLTWRCLGVAHSWYAVDHVVPGIEPGLQYARHELLLFKLSPLPWIFKFYFTITVSS